ncbi:hypothetical protein Tco_1367875 [Tanacetum coccineum]
MAEQQTIKEFWSTAFAYDPFSSTDETEQRPLREFLIKFSVLNGQRPLTLDFNTFCSSTSLDYNNGKYVAHPTPEAVKKELGKIAINPSYLDKTPVLKNSFPVAWRILFTFVILVLGGNCSSTEQVKSIQQLLAYCLITGTEDENFEFLPGILSNSNFPKDPSKVIDIELTTHMIAINNQMDSVSPPPLSAKPKKGKSQTVTPTLPKDLTSTTSDEGTTKTTSRPKRSLEDKDSGGNNPPADMETINPPVADPLGTGELDTQPLVLSTYADVRAFLLSDDEAQESKEDILGDGKEMDEEPQAASIAKTHHQSPPPQVDKPQSSHAPSTEASNTDSSCDDIIKKYDNTLPLTERQLIKYLRKVSNALFARITKDNWEKHEEAAINYADLKASIDEYYDENIAHRDQTDKLVEASMSSLNKSSNTISDLYKGFNIITKFLKEIKNAIKDYPVINKKISKATESFTKISTNITEVYALKQDEELAAWAKSSTNMAWNLGSRLLGLERAQNHIQSSIVTPTLALTHILANVEGENDTNTATKDPPSHTKGETNANRQKKSEEPKHSTDANIELIGSSKTQPSITQAQPITIINPEPVIPQREGKGIATDEQVEDQKKLVKALSIIRPDPDALIPYTINGELEVIKVVREEAKKLGIHRKEAFITKAGEKFKKAQDAKHEILKRQHTKKVKKYIELRKHKFDNYMWTISSRLKPETITDIKIHPKTKPVVITVFRGTDGRNFDVHKPFAFALPAHAPAPKQASSKSSRKKRKHMELEPEIKIP